MRATGCGNQGGEEGVGADGVGQPQGVGDADRAVVL
jgi:hypothetical protein